LYNPAILGLKPIAILITHAHPDHAYGLKDEKIQNWLSEQRIELYSHKEAIELLPEELPFTEVKPLKAFRIGPFEITAVPVYHSIKAPAVAYLIEVGGQRIWYSPDFLWLKKEQHGHLKDLDVYIGDGSSLTRTLLRRKDKEIFGHMSVKKQLNLLTRLNPEGLPHVIFTHFGKEGVEHEDLQGFLNDLSPELSPVAAYDCLQLKVTGLRKLELERFRHEGIDEDIERKWERWPELIADLRYLWNSAYPRLKRGQKWGEWTLEDVLRYGAKIVDTLRSMYFPIMPPKPLPKTSYWQAYREAEKYMKSKPPADEQELAAWEAKRKRLFEIGKLKRRR
jgi:L-ascorbate metabolism protein UlaG (beta-lactamase superfamily)